MFGLQKNSSKISRGFQKTQSVCLYINGHKKRNNTSKHSAVDKKRKLDNGYCERIVNEYSFYGQKDAKSIDETDLDKENINASTATNQKPKLDCSDSNVPVEMTAIRKFRSSSLDINNKNFERLTVYITKKYNQMKQPQEIYSQKINLRQQIFELLTGSYLKMSNICADIDLYIVGSTLNRTATIFSDLDMCLVLRSCREEEALLYAKDILLNIKKILPPRFDACLILAKVPLLKVTDTQTGIQMDLNINNKVGIRNTQLVYCYTKSKYKEIKLVNNVFVVDSRVAPLIVFTKLWARQYGINDAHKKTFSSYNYSLLMIHFLQYACSPPVLPCLHELLPNQFSPESDVKTLSLHINLPNYESENKQTLGELFLEFLFYFGFKFAYERDMVSVRTGRTIPKSAAAQNADWHWSFIAVEEPFTCKNTAQAIYDENAFNLILKTFRRSCLHFPIDDCESIDVAETML